MQIYNSSIVHAPFHNRPKPTVRQSSALVNITKTYDHDGAGMNPRRDPEWKKRYSADVQRKEEPRRPQAAALPATKPARACEPAARK
jgi:hypothetical protein